MIAALLILAAAVEVETVQAPATEGPPRETSERELVEAESWQPVFSLPTESDRDAWASPGFRFSLAPSVGGLVGSGPAPSMATTGVILRARLRLDPSWSVAATAQYHYAWSGFLGLRWLVGIEPILHPMPGLSVSVGVGIGGLYGNTETTQPNLSAPGVSWTVPDDRTVYLCQGGGAALTARVEYEYVVGQMFATGPFLQADATRVRCVQDRGAELETGLRLEDRQWWTHVGGSLGWWLSWR